VSFTLVAAGQSAITSVGLQVNTPGKSYGAIPRDVKPTFSPGSAVRATWIWDSPGPGNQLPPGVDIAYRWSLQDTDGNTMQSDWATIRYGDGRYSWREKSQPGVNLYWYEGGEDFGAQLMNAAQSGLDKLRQEQGVDLKNAVSIYVYSDQRGLRGAMLGSPTWIGGRAYPEFGTILLVIDQSGLDAGERSLVHELTHQLVYQQTFDPLLGSHVPLWLNEGLAVTSEGPTAPEFERALSAAVKDNRVQSFRNLDGAFPSDTKASTLAYAQSESFVRYLLGIRGAGGMRSLLSALQRGNRIDAALTQTYGTDLDGVQDSWRTSVGAPPLTTPAVRPELKSGVGGRRSALVGPGSLGALPLVASFIFVSAALIVAISLMLRSVRAATRGGRAP
jgi:hypothetical protein